MSTYPTGVRLREERKRLGKKQAEMADLCGISRPSWGEAERGNSMPGGEVLRRFALGGGDVHYVLTGERLGTVLTPDERALVELYRTSPPVLRTAAFSVLAGGNQPVSQSAGAGGITIGAGAQAGGDIGSYNQSYGENTIVRNFYGGHFKNLRIGGGKIEDDDDDK